MTNEEKTNRSIGTQNMFLATQLAPFSYRERKKGKLQANTKCFVNTKTKMGVLLNNVSLVKSSILGREIIKYGSWLNPKFVNTSIQVEKSFL